MTMTRRYACSAVLGLLPMGALAQQDDYPTKPITVLAPFAPGGTVDIVARLLGQRIGTLLKQPMLIENRGGAGGTIATAMLARAVPDGYTLMMHHMGLAFNASLYEKLPFDTARDIVPVAHAGATPNVLVVTPSLPINTVAEFLAYAKARPDAINYGSGGPGSAGHIPMEVLQSATGVRLTHVPYKGSGPAINDLVSGQIQTMLLTIPAVLQQIQAGRLRAIATSGLRRTPALPNVPTLDEAGVKGFNYAPWYGYFAPRGTPAATLNKLHSTINTALQDPDIASKLAVQGLEVEPMSRQQFADIVVRDTAVWGKTIRALGLKGG